MKFLKIKEISKVDWGNTNLTKKAYVESGKYLGFSAAGPDGRLNHFEHQRNKPTMSAIGANCGKMYFIEEKFTAIKNTIVFNPNENLVIPKYLYYFCDYYSFPKRGAGQPFIAKTDIENSELPVPSLQEQEKIVEKLDKVFENIDKLIEDTAKNIEFSKILYGKVLDDHFNFENKKNIFISVSELVDSGVLQKPFDGNHGEQHPKASDYVDNGVPFLMASDLKNGLVDTVNCKFIPNTIAKNLRIDSSKNNDILLTHKGTIGRTAILKTDLDLVVLTPQVTSYRILNENILLRDYLFNYFKSPYFQKILFTIAKSGSTRAYIGITKQLDLLIPIPELETQKNICKNIYNFENNYFKLSENLNNKITKLIELKSSILNNQFNPELYKVVA